MKDKNSKLKETRLLLNLYPVNSLRLERIEARLKVEGKTRTWWINAAIREKLDKDHPETNKPEGEYVPVPLTLDTPEAHARYRRIIETCDRLLAAYVPAAPLRGVSTMVDAADQKALSEKYKSLSQEEKDLLEETAERLVQMTPPSPKDFKPWSEQWQRECEASALRREAAESMVKPAPAPVETEDDDPDFWGETFLKVKAKAGK
jgi:hypothetical protein